MSPISAADSVSLAIQRTRDFLFRPFRWGTYLKLGLVAIITEGIGSNSGSSKHGGPSAGHGPMIYSPFDIPPVWIAAIVAAVLLAILISIVVFYLITRLRFAFFHCLIHNTKRDSPRMAALSGAGDALFLAESGGGILLSAAAGVGRPSVRSRICTALS